MTNPPQLPKWWTTAYRTGAACGLICRCTWDEDRTLDATRCPIHADSAP